MTVFMTATVGIASMNEVQTAVVRVVCIASLHESLHNTVYVKIFAGSKFFQLSPDTFVKFS